MKDYEALIILKPELEGDALKISSEEVSGIFKKYDCNVETKEEIGKRALSYPVAKKKEGLFYLIRFKSDPANVNKIRREFSLNENVLRAFVAVRGKETLPIQP